ncbi:hypothetical protein LCGC14_3078190, partial [marine sediment metagenome]
MNVRTKIIGATVLVLAICLGGTSVFMARLAEQRMVSAGSASVVSIGSIALQEVLSTMDKGHDYGIQRLLENITATPYVMSARIISTNGTVLHSGVPGEAGRTVPGFGPPGEGPMTSRETDTLVHLVPLKNQSECFSCHGASAKHLGVIELVYDISSGSREVTSTRRFLLLSGILILVLV